MYKMLDNNYNKVLKELFNKPTNIFYIRQLTRITGLNPNTIINITNKLMKEGLVKKNNKKHIVEISLNLENKETIEKKRIFNLYNIYNSGVINFLIKTYKPKSISIIGTYSRGEDIEESDIDLVVDSNNRKIIDLSKFEKILKKKIHLILLPKKFSEEFFNNLINGIVLYGAIRK